jgi:hypothetical protein
MRRSSEFAIQNVVRLLGCGSGLVGLVLGGVLGGGALLLVCLVVGLFTSGALVYAAPSHLNAWAWLRDVLRFALIRPRLTRPPTAEPRRVPASGGRRSSRTRRPAS